MLLEPFHQGQVVGHAPEAGHGGVGMGIDESRQDNPAGRIQGPAAVHWAASVMGPTAAIWGPCTATKPG